MTKKTVNKKPVLDVSVPQVEKVVPITQLLEEKIEDLNHAMVNLNGEVVTYKNTISELRSSNQSLSTRLRNSEAIIKSYSETFAKQDIEIERFKISLGRIPNWIKSLFNV